LNDCWAVGAAIGAADFGAGSGTAAGGVLSRLANRAQHFAPIAEGSAPGVHSNAMDANGDAREF
jgi:hypothetical protein